MSAAGEGRFPAAAPQIWSTYDVGGGLSRYLAGTGVRWAVERAAGPRTCEGDFLAPDEIPEGHAPVTGPLDVACRVWFDGGPGIEAFREFARSLRGDAGAGVGPGPAEAGCFWVCRACALRSGLATDSPLSREVAP